VENMTALVSTFARAYHYRSCPEHIFADPPAEKMLSKEEYAGIACHMSEGIAYFAPSFQGSQEEALQLIVERQLAPSVLARSAFAERALNSAILTGCRQVAVYACGYDTFSLRTGNRELTVFELDREEMIRDRKRRIEEAKLKPVCQVHTLGCDLSEGSWPDKLTGTGFCQDRQSFGTLLGITYYLSKEEFRSLLSNIASITCEGSAICFDYPHTESGEESRKNRELASAAREEMKAEYTCDELETLLAEYGFLIYEHLNAAEAEQEFFASWNQRNPRHIMHAHSGVGYCLAVKNR